MAPNVFVQLQIESVEWARGSGREKRSRIFISKQNPENVETQNSSFVEEFAVQIKSRYTMTYYISSILF